MIKVRKVDTPEEALEIWNNTKGNPRATLDQVKVCTCGHCSGFMIIKKEGHRGNKYK